MILPFWLPMKCCLAALWVDSDLISQLIVSRRFFSSGILLPNSNFFSWGMRSSDYSSSLLSCCMVVIHYTLNVKRQAFSVSCASVGAPQTRKGASAARKRPSDTGRNVSEDTAKRFVANDETFRWMGKFALSRYFVRLSGTAVCGRVRRGRASRRRCRQRW